MKNIRNLIAEKSANNQHISTSAHRHIISLITVYCLLFTISSFGQQPLYLNSRQPVDQRVEDLLSRMTVEEKIRQLKMPAPWLFRQDSAGTPAGKRIAKVS